MVDKELDIRWRQRFCNLVKAESQLEQAIAAYQNDSLNKLYDIALIKSFEIIFELSWKTIKDFLEYQGIIVKLPREIIKQAFASSVVDDGQCWIDMLEKRNGLAFISSEEVALEAIKIIINRFFPVIIDISYSSD